MGDVKTIKCRYCCLTAAGQERKRMSNIEKFNEIVDYIEEHLTGEIDVGTAAQMANMSIYEFRRIFSFIAGIPLGEYIRKRRLSAAAEELLTTQNTITYVASKYGYDSPASFSRSFKAFHGIAPAEITKSGNAISMYTKIDFTFCARGGKDIVYRVTSDDGFYIRGLTGISGEEDTECCEQVWNAFYEDEALQKEIPACGGQIYAAYRNGENAVAATIGVREKNGSADALYIPPAKWACFTLRGSDDRTVNAFYEDVICRWLESGSYVRDERIPNLEVFPMDMEAEDFPWEIRIPLCAAEEEK